MPEALEELGEETVTALSLLVNEGAADDDIIEDEDESGELPKTIEGLTALVQEQKEKITKRNKSLKKSKQAQHRTQDENNTLQSQFEALETRLDAKVDGIGKPNVEAESLAKEEQEWQDRVEDDPTQAIGYMNWKNAQRDQNLASFLSQKLGQIEQNFNELKSSTDPEKLEYKSEIAQLKANPQFAHLDEATALTVAKALKATKVPGRGGISGKRVTAQAKSTAFELTDDDKRKMGFTV